MVGRRYFDIRLTSALKVLLILLFGSYFFLLSKHNKELAEFLRIDETEDEATADNALKYYSKHTAQIEVFT